MPSQWFQHPALNSVGSGRSLDDLWSQQPYMRTGGVGLTGMDPRFFNDPRFEPIDRQLELDTHKGGDRGYIVKMGRGNVPNEQIRTSTGGWDSAPVGTGKPEDWYANGPHRITTSFTADQPTSSLTKLMQKLQQAPSASTNLGTGGKLGEGEPNFADQWMFDTAKGVIGKSSQITPEMVDRFRYQMVNDLGHRPEMSY